MICGGYWIYDKEQCNYCLNRQNCSYIKDVNKYISAICAIEKIAKNVYGTTEFKCDYFIFDIEKYHKENEGTCEGGN